MSKKIGVLLVNLGTPAAPTISAVRRYLFQFLSDTRVVELPRWLWRCILYFVILPFRAKKLVPLYENIWMDRGSPLKVFTSDQVHAVEQSLVDLPVIVKMAMTYDQPSITTVLDELAAQSIHKVLVCPLYPQYSATTTAAVFDQVARHFARRRNLPELYFIRDYYRESGYIHALAESVKNFQRQYGVPDKLILSFHGIPQVCVEKGDPYFQQCKITAQKLAESLKLSPDAWLMTFQSRFGKQAWLQPYLDQTLATLPVQGVRHVQVICPGFAADCLETLEEVADQNKKIFLQAGGETFHYIPALNAQASHIQFLSDFVKAKIASF